MGVGPAALGWSPPPIPLVPEGEMLGKGGEGGPAVRKGGQDPAGCLLGGRWSSPGGRGWVLWCGMGSGEGSELCPEQQEGPDGVSGASSSSSSSFLLPSDVCVSGSGLSACWGEILPWIWDPLGSF